jgi:hypothetical protein
MIVPARLDTQVQEWFELYGGHSKGRGFSPHGGLSRHDPQSPLFPLPPSGAAWQHGLPPGGADPHRRL